MIRLPGYYLLIAGPEQKYDSFAEKNFRELSG